MINRWLKAGAAVTLALALGACGNMNTDRNVQDGDGVTTKGTRDRALLDNNGMIDRSTRNNGRSTNYSSMHNNTRMDVDERIAEAVAELGEVDTATVLMTDKNAYVAVMLDNGGMTANRADGVNTRSANNNGRVNTRQELAQEGDNLTDDLTPDLKRKIADRVKQEAPHIRNVYVSANADFVGTMRGYGEQVRNGQPLRGALIEFNRMVERVFPDNAER